MSRGPERAPASDDVLNEVIAAFLEGVAAGREPDRADLLRRHPELAGELAAFFADHDRLHQLAAPLRPTDDPGPTIPFSPAGFPESDNALPPHPGGRFGDYDLLEEIACGGMGVVYKARQRTLNRVVALKMILAGELATSAEVQRFRLEASAAAELDHPNIVPIYEVGEHQGQHYFTMKLIDGGSLAAQAAAFRDRPRDAARLLATVARAVHFAHQRGILHRDLKPANILLQRGKAEGGRRKQEEADGGSFPLPPSAFPLVTDFGLAKRLNQMSTLTQSGVVGTPGYMAPEQAKPAPGKVSIAADVYGLGAVLYALLTGQAPFGGESPLDTLLAVTEKEPEPPHALNTRVDRDLETICLKCLRKEPKERYASAEALAEELERWLAGEPIQARPVGIWERSIKWARRRPKTALLAAVVAVQLMLAAGAFLWHTAALSEALTLARQNAAAAEKALAQSRQNAAAAEKALGEADANFQAARDAIDSVLTRLAEEELLHVPQMEALRRRVLQDALAFYQRLLHKRGHEPGVRYETARAYRRVADIHGLLGETAEALPLYGEALKLHEALCADYPNEPAYLLEQAVTRGRRGQALHLLGRLNEAEADFDAGLSIVTPLLAGGLASVSRGVADLQNARGALLQITSRPVESRQAFMEAVRLGRALAQRLPTDAAVRRELAGSLLLLGRTQRELDDRDLAMKSFEEAVTIQRALVREQIELVYRQSLSRGLVDRGILFKVTHQFDKSENDFREALKLCTELSEKHPDVPLYREDLARVHTQLGLWAEAKARAGKGDRTALHAAAEKSLRDSLALREQLVKSYPEVRVFRQELARNHNLLGEELRVTGKRDAAEEHFRQALALGRALVEQYPTVPGAHHDLGVTLLGLAHLQMTVDDSQALARAEEALASLRTALKPNPRQPIYRRNIFSVFLTVMDIRLRQKDHAAAAKVVDEAVPLLPNGGDGPYKLGRRLAQCAALAEKDEQLSAEKRSEWKEAYASRAVAQLREALHRGYKDPDDWKDKRLRPLLDRPDFQQLLRDAGR